ncbi:MAG: hypothetical protein ACI31A_01315 [Candidatus Limisoma sp.]
MKTIHKSLTFSALVCIAILATSCRDDLRTGNSRNDGRIAFSINSGNDWQTRAAADSTAIETYHIQQKVMPIIVGNDTLMLTLTIEPNFGIEAPAPAETRSAPVTTATLKGFHTVAYCQDNGQRFFSEDYTWTDHSKPVETNHFWPNNRQLAFCAYALQTIDNMHECTPKEDNRFSTITTNYDESKGGLNGSFEYTSPGNNEATDYAYRDAFVQPDPVIAITQNKQKQTENVDLTFHHALAAVRFRLGDIPEDLYIQDVIISKVFQSGKCDFKLDDSNVNFDWTNQSTIIDFSQEICTGYKITDTSSTNPKDLYCTDSNTAEVDESTFFIVPQKFEGDNADAAIELKATLRNSKDYNGSEPDYLPAEDRNCESGEIRIKKAFTAFGIDKLQADYRYTFTLSMAGSMGISVTDDLDTSTKIKSNVKIKNTGKSTGWVRAAIVGWWKNTAGNIVAPWNDLPNESCTYGEYKTAADWSSYWKKGSDGFFYYRRSLLPQKVTDRDLFDEYKLTGSAPVTEAILEIDIVAQIIRKDAESQLTSSGSLGWNFPTW